MNVSKVTTALKNFSGKPLGVASKALGVATCASVLYDSFVNAKDKSCVVDEIDTGNRVFSQYQQFMTSDTQSATVCKLKRMWYNIQLGFPFYHVASRTKGFAKGFGATIARGLPLIGLSAVAIKSKSPIGKAAGVLLAANGVKTFLHDVVGIGLNKGNKLSN